MLDVGGMVVDVVVDGGGEQIKLNEAASWKAPEFWRTRGPWALHRRACATALGQGGPLSAEALRARLGEGACG